MRVARRWVVSLSLSLPLAATAAGSACSDFSEDESGRPPSSDAGSDVATGASDAAPSGDDGSALDGNADAHVDAGSRAFRYVFVTSGTHDSRFGEGDGGLTGADGFCANQALGTELAGLKWRAWLGTLAENPRDRIAQDAGVVAYDYRLTTGEIVFRKGFRFIEGLLLPEHNVDRDEKGAPVLEAEVWTGAGTDGRTYPSPDTNCVSWTHNAGGYSGITAWTTRGDAAPSGSWTSASDAVNRTCAAAVLHHVYCFEVD